MVNSEEKRKLLENEEKLRKKLAWQWKQLRDTVTQPIMYAFMIHPKHWGHQTKSWKKATNGQQLHEVHPVMSEPPLSIGQVLPLHDKVVPPPPVLPPRNRGDTYDNRSTVLTNSQDEELEDFEFREGSDHTVSVVVENGVDSAAEDDNTTLSPTIHHPDEDLPEPDEDSHASPVMVACPPPYLTVYDDPQYANFYQEEDFDSRYQQVDSQAMYDDLDQDYTPQYQDQNTSNSYNQEFSEFYANYEEGAAHLYYEDYGDEDAVGDPCGG